MARGRVQLKRIENPVHRQVTFCKRRAGLLKKAKELSVLCDAQIGLFIFSSHGKLFELATNGSMQGMIDKYLKTTTRTGPLDQAPEECLPTNAKEEIRTLKQELELLQKGIRYIFGGGEGRMNLEELLQLEKHLEFWMGRIRSIKMDIMLKEIQGLRNKEGVLKAANKYLQQKIEESNFNTVAANFGTMADHGSCSLTFPNDIFQY